MPSRHSRDTLPNAAPPAAIGVFHRDALDWDAGNQKGKVRKRTDARIREGEKTEREKGKQNEENNHLLPSKGLEFRGQLRILSIHHVKINAQVANVIIMLRIDFRQPFLFLIALLKVTHARYESRENNKGHK